MTFSGTRFKNVIIYSAGTYLFQKTYKKTSLPSVQSFVCNAPGQLPLLIFAFFHAALWGLLHRVPEASELFSEAHIISVGVGDQAGAL